MLMCIFIQTSCCVQTGIFLCFDGKKKKSLSPVLVRKDFASVSVQVFYHSVRV